MPSLRLFHLQASARLICERSFAIGPSRGPIVPAFTHHHPLHASKAASSCPFSTTSPHPRKGAPKAKKLLPSSDSAHIPDNKAQANRDHAIDPSDFSELETKIKHQIDWLRESLQKLRSGGRLSLDTIEGLNVELKHGLGEKKSVEKVRLGDLATVVPKGGRLMTVLVNEEAHLKPITTAIQLSPHSLTPQPDFQNPTLQLNIPVPPPTAESRAQSLADAKKEYETASTGVKDARGHWQKWYRKAEKDKLVIRDELEKAHKKMEGVVEKGQKQVKEVYEQAVKGMER